MHELIRKGDSKEFGLSKTRPTLVKRSPQIKAKSKQTKLAEGKESVQHNLGNRAVVSPRIITLSALSKANPVQGKLAKAKREYLTLMSRKRCNSPEV